ncbi:hypothetical protein ACIP93_27505 [Streptomyces sp. NPDC088745]|uniref:hypothetical protein n=1 Tax=Streptomyces sp. NPDC088745 TaxID=3365884 RepID=UPI00382FA6EA
MTTAPGAAAPPPRRTDARLKRDRPVAAAREVFAASGGSGLEVIRNFPFLVTGAVCGVLAAVAGWSGSLALVGGYAVPGWQSGAVLLAVSLILLGVHYVRGVRRYAASGAESMPSRRSLRLLLALALLTAAAALGCGQGALSDMVNGAEYRVLAPTGPGGCTAVVREESFLESGRGEVYAVGDPGLARTPSGTWEVDAGHRPVAAGSYELTWGDGGSLTVRDSGTGPAPALDVEFLACP